MITDKYTNDIYVGNINNPIYMSSMQTFLVIRCPIVFIDRTETTEKDCFTVIRSTLIAVVLMEITSVIHYLLRTVLRLII